MSSEFKQLIEEFSNLLSQVYPEDLKEILLERTMSTLDSIDQLKNTIQLMKMNLLSYQAI